MFVPVVASLGVFGLWISRLHMGNLARILVAMFVSMVIIVMLALVATLLDVVHLWLAGDTKYIGVNREMIAITR